MVFHPAKSSETKKEYPQVLLHCSLVWGKHNSDASQRAEAPPCWIIATSLVSTIPNTASSLVLVWREGVSRSKGHVDLRRVCSPSDATAMMGKSMLPSWKDIWKRKVPSGLSLMGLPPIVDRSIGLGSTIDNQLSIGNQPELAGGRMGGAERREAHPRHGQARHGGYRRGRLRLGGLRQPYKPSSRGEDVGAGPPAGAPWNRAHCCMEPNREPATRLSLCGFSHAEYIVVNGVTFSSGALAGMLQGDQGLAGAGPPANRPVMK